MTKILIILYSFLSIVFGYGQSGRATFALSENNLYYGKVDLSNGVILDTTVLTIVYQYCQTTTGENKSKKTELTVLQVGSRYTKYFGLADYYDSYAYTKAKYSPGSNFTPTTTEEKEMAIAGDPIMPVEIFYKRGDMELVIQNTMPFKDNFTMQYAEKLPLQEWNILPQTDSIGGYMVQLAVTHFGGRLWSAWFTPQIPITAGPWKFLGLPGIILKVYDSQNQFAFDCTKISQKEHAIYKYTVPGKHTTKNQWLKFMKQAHEHPYTQFSNNGINKFYFMDKNGLMELDGSWTIPYNPIELE